MSNCSKCGRVRQVSRRSRRIAVGEAAALVQPVARGITLAGICLVAASVLGVVLALAQLA